tara:strand:+ start:21 stop:200 length:180 start_codon:yes stop_codon:yes gene_type:complete
MLFKFGSRHNKYIVLYGGGGLNFIGRLSFDVAICTISFEFWFGCAGVDCTSSLVIPTVV